MPIQVVVGVNWGDEGKGRIVDYLSETSDIVVRYQGGNNAGHTIINEFGKFKLHLLPSGIFRSNVINVMGPGTVIDLEMLVKEIEDIEKAGIRVGDNYRISDRATISFPFHRLLDAYEEERLGKKRFGSTKRGIAPAYGDRYLKKGIQIGELLHPKYLKDRLTDVVAWENLLITRVYEKPPIKLENMMSWVETYGNRVKKHICDTNPLLENAVQSKKNILFEAQLGALRDIYFGIYPFSTSSCCLSSFAQVGGGVFNYQNYSIIGVMKAYSTSVGEGPFVTELKNAIGNRIREKGLEYGAATGRPRRIGYFDAVASRYGVKLQSTTNIALTKLDVLSREKTLKICTHYKIGNDLTDEFPINAELEGAKPIYEEWPGWTEDISKIRSFGNLPKNAQKYVLRIEKLVGCPIRYISVGPTRESIIIKK
jgi:adenylosuccinate synthase